jgi:hypothetical protein
MNLCVVSEYSCTFEDFKEMVDKTTGETDAFLTEMELIKVHDHKSVLLLHCTDMQALIAFMSTPEMKQWDAENNCVDVLYSMEQMN